MHVIGIDLAGPANHKETAVAVFKKEADSLVLNSLSFHNSDRLILDTVRSLASGGGELAIGMDAPLSYQDGGGDRPSDKAVRSKLREAGLYHGSIMPPTLNRMVYLTLRGIHLSRALENYTGSIVEVHPGGAMGLRLKPEERNLALSYKKSEADRRSLLPFLEHWRMKNILPDAAETSHGLDACAAALAAWHWADAEHEPEICIPAEPPFHPFDFCC
ncbi:DUF429 domain-containing protein [Metabacillus indicus]|uniref:DUF429 domain-containing protein n=1 Tax=Metabacillus indicus TaxID=246786 RepID=UPI0024922471|nr:DUF429 domain-containing protein [Metabacillus indicus]